MQTVSGYHITEHLYESSHSLVYRGCRLNNQQAVILKLLKNDYPPPERVAWFKREYEITRDIHLQGVVTAYTLENDYNRWLMTLEDFGGGFTPTAQTGRYAGPG